MSNFSRPAVHHRGGFAADGHFNHRLRIGQVHAVEGHLTVTMPGSNLHFRVAPRCGECRRP